MKKYVNGKYVDLTSEEIAAMQTEVRKFELMEKSRPMTELEVYRMVVTLNVNSLEVDDNTALRMLDFYPEWIENTTYTVGFKVRYKGKLWRVIQEHTAITGWEPNAAPALWEQINETHSGAIDDPIPYEGNMALTAGLHYHQDFIIYLCNRDTVNPVYNHLADLVGLYVEVV